MMFRWLGLLLILVFGIVLVFGFARIAASIMGVKGERVHHG